MPQKRKSDFELDNDEPPTPKRINFDDDVILISDDEEESKLTSSSEITRSPDGTQIQAGNSNSALNANFNPKEEFSEEQLARKNDITQNPAKQSSPSVNSSGPISNNSAMSDNSLSGARNALFLNKLITLLFQSLFEILPELNLNPTALHEKLSELVAEVPSTRMIRDLEKKEMMCKSESDNIFIDFIKAYVKRSFATACDTDLGIIPSSALCHDVKEEKPEVKTEKVSNISCAIKKDPDDVSCGIKEENDSDVEILNDSGPCVTPKREEVLDHSTNSNESSELNTNNKEEKSIEKINGIDNYSKENYRHSHSAPKLVQQQSSQSPSTAPDTCEEQVEFVVQLAKYDDLLPARKPLNTSKPSKKNSKSISSNLSDKCQPDIRPSNSVRVKPFSELTKNYSQSLNKDFNSASTSLNKTPELVTESRQEKLHEELLNPSDAIINSQLRENGKFLEAPGKERNEIQNLNFTQKSDKNATQFPFVETPEERLIPQDKTSDRKSQHENLTELNNPMSINEVEKNSESGSQPINIESSFTSEGPDQLPRDQECDSTGNKYLHTIINQEVFHMILGMCSSNSVNPSNLRNDEIPVPESTQGKSSETPSKIEREKKKKKNVKNKMLSSGLVTPRSNPKYLKGVGKEGSLLLRKCGIKTIGALKISQRSKTKSKFMIWLVECVKLTPSNAEACVNDLNKIRWRKLKAARTKKNEEPKNQKEPKI